MDYESSGYCEFDRQVVRKPFGEEKKQQAKAGKTQHIHTAFLYVNGKTE